MEKVSLPVLEYELNALEPVISRELLEIHYKKHHQAYVTGTNLAIEKIEAFRKGGDISLKSALRDFSFNYNGHILHNIFWTSMRAPKKNNAPQGKLLSLIEKNFGSFEIFKKEFSEAAKTTEGSGWAVLFKKHDQLFTMQVEKHNLMHLAGMKPVLVLDVWEHAYYLDYKNDRGAFVEKWWDLVNWDNLEKRLEKCKCGECNC